MGLPRIIKEASNNKIEDYNSIWFLRNGEGYSGSTYPIEYALVILYALRSWMRRYEGADARDILSQCQQVLNGEKEFLNEASFLQIYSLKGADDTFCVIDQSDGCFPLVLYGEKERRGPEDRSRTLAFRERLKDILGNIDILVAFLKSDENWTKEFQSKLLIATFSKASPDGHS